MSKSILYASNTAQNIAVTTPTVINFGQVVRRYGCNTNLSGGNAVVKGVGYYDVDVNINFEGTIAGTLNIQLYKDGVAIPGAVAVATVVAGDTYSFTIPAIIRESCNCEATITAEISNITGTISSASIRVVKL